MKREIDDWEFRERDFWGGGVKRRIGFCPLDWDLCREVDDIDDDEEETLSFIRR